MKLPITTNINHESFVTEAEGYVITAQSLATF